MRYFTLKPQYALRGWKDIKYAVVDLECKNIRDRVLILTQLQFEALELLTAGGVSADEPLIPKKLRKMTELAAAKGFLVECGRDKKLEDYQKYRYTEAKYTHTMLWSVTGNCNLRCRHCYISSDENKYGEVSLEKCREVIRQCREANVDMVALTGGEPLVRKDFWKIVDMLSENHITLLQVFTNGIAVDEKFMDEFQSRDLHPNCFMLSFDGVNCHDWLRGVKGAEKKAVAAIKLIRSRGYEVTVSTSLHNGNIGSLIDTYELMKELGVMHWKAVPIVDTGNWRGQSDRGINYSAVFDEYIKLIKIYKNEGMPLRLGLGGFFQGFKNNSEKWYIPFVSGCGSCERESDYLCETVRVFPYLLPDGRLLPCIAMSGSSMENIAPNIFDEGQSLEKALSVSPIDTYCSYTYKELFKNNSECAACENRYRCSGCRANALACGGYFEKDPMACSFFKDSYEENIKSIMDEG